MTDRELLEAAARAAEIEVWRGSMPHQRETLFRSAAPGDGKVTGMEWNPLTDDGDALRLAVTLGITARQRNRAVYAEHPGLPDDWNPCAERHDADPYAATRRAIVRAAAAMAQQRGEG